MLGLCLITFDWYIYIYIYIYTHTHIHTDRLTMFARLMYSFDVLSNKADTNCLLIIRYRLEYLIPADAVRVVVNLTN